MMSQSQFLDACHCFIFSVTSNHVVTSTQSLKDVHKQYSQKCEEAEYLSQSQNAAFSPIFYCFKLPDH